MNTLITRLLGGAACTVGVLALGMGVAQADETNVLADAAAKVGAGSHAAKAVVKKATPHLNKVRVGSGTDLTARVGKATASSSSRTGRGVSAAASANPTRHRTLAARVVGSRGGGVTATGSSTGAGKAATGKAEVKANRAPRPTVVPAVVGDVNATAVDLPVVTCIRINAGDCSGSGSSGGGDSDQSSALADLLSADVADLTPTEVADVTPTIADSTLVADGTPAVVADTTASAADLAGLDSCIRINAGDCSSTGSGTTSRRGLLAGLTPAVIADTTATAAGLADLDSCIRVNGGDCTTSGGSGTGSGGSSDPAVAADLIPAVVSDTTAGAAGLAGLDSCIRINAGDCSGSGSTSQPSTLAGLIPSVLAKGAATVGGTAQGTACLGINAACGSDTSTGGGTGGVGTGEGFPGGGGTGSGTGFDGSGVGSAIDDGIGGSVGSRAGLLAASLFVVPLGGPGSGALASTGVSARMVGVLVAGLLLLLMALPMLRRRRSG
jgi:hypothetical protein